MSDLKIAQALDTHPFTCDGSFGDSTWSNPEGRAITLRFMRAWIGVGCHQLTDAMVLPYRCSDGMTLGPYAQDHYAGPATPHEQITYYPEPGIVIAPDDGIYFRWFGNWQGQIFDPAAAVMPLVMSQAKAQVRQAYELLLHREPSEIEIIPWATALCNYSVTPATMCNAITASPEYAASVKAHAQVWVGYTVDLEQVNPV